MNLEDHMSSDLLDKIKDDFLDDTKWVSKQSVRYMIRNELYHYADKRYDFMTLSHPFMGYQNIITSQNGNQP